MYIKHELGTDDITLLIGYTLLFIIGTTGNGLVLIIFRHYWRHGPVLEQMILYLAVFDLLSSFFSPLLFSYWILNGETWDDLGFFCCKFFPSFVRILTNMSLLFTLLIAIDRRRAIVTPFKDRPTHAQVHIIAALALIISFVWEFYYIYYVELDFSYEPRVCGIFDHTGTYTILSIVFILSRDLVFILVMVWTSLESYITLRKSDQRQGIRRSKQILAILVWMFIVSCVAILPRDLLHLAYSMSSYTKPISDSPTILLVNSSLKLLSASNSIYNVFIYAGKHDNFWSDVMYLFCRRRNVDFTGGRRRSLRYPQYSEQGKSGSDLRVNSLALTKHKQRSLIQSTTSLHVVNPR